jgi:hypothetical protein
MGRTAAQNAKRRIELRAFVASLKDAPCLDCGKSYEPFCMDFDHVGEKRSDISSMVRNTYSLEAILREISKTELVCVICHRDRSYRRTRSKESELSQNKYAIKTRKRLAELRQIVYSAKSKPCVTCGASYDPWLMDLDHVDGAKVMHVAAMAGKNASKPDLVSEIAKCQVLCALCHRRKSSKDEIDRASLARIPSPRATG